MLVYQNNFDKTPYGFPAIPPHFFPTLDLVGLGNMNSAANNGATTTFARGLALPEPGGIVEDTGTVVAVVGQLGQFSETIYATLPNALLQSGRRYTAELIFDSPNVLVGSIAAQPTWTVALSFKNGDLTDNPADKNAAISCQFSGAGIVKFHFVVDGGNPSNTIYADFNQDIVNPTRFKLTFTIHEGAGGVLEGTGSLSYGHTEIPPSNIIPVPPAVALPTFADLTVVGLSLVTTTGGSFGIRFRSFTLSSSSVA
jgi:hypothetical protein